MDRALLSRLRSVTTSDPSTGSGSSRAVSRDDTRPVRAAEELEWPRLEAWLREHLPASGLRPDAAEPMQVAQFPGGHSNLTYQVTIGALGLVVRRPPFGPVPPT